MCIQHTSGIRHLQVLGRMSTDCCCIATHMTNPCVKWYICSFARSATALSVAYVSLRPATVSSLRRVLTNSQIHSPIVRCCSPTASTLVAAPLQLLLPAPSHSGRFESLPNICEHSSWSSRFGGCQVVHH